MLTRSQSIAQQSKAANVREPNVRRLERIIEALEKEDWSIRKFLEEYTTQKLDVSERRTRPLEHRQRLFCSALDESETLGKLYSERYKPGESRYFVPLARLRKERKELSKPKDGYSIFSQLSEIDEVVPQDLPKVTTAVSDIVKKKAPCIYQVLYTLLQPRRGSDQEESTLPTFARRCSIIVAIIMRSFARNTCNALNRLFTIYFYFVGAQRRALETLSGFGICEGYWSLLKHLNEQAARSSISLHQIALNPSLIIAYDNFQYYENVQEARLGNIGKLVSATTGKAIVGRDIPPLGLQQSMLDETKPLLKESFDKAYQTNTVDEDIQAFQVFEAISSVYKDALQSCFERPKAPKVPQMPTINRLELEKTQYHNFKPMHIDESTIQGTYDITEDLFLKQLKLDKKSPKAVEFFTNGLRLAYGDQLTVDRLRSVAAQQTDASSPYDRRTWLLPMISPFHFRMSVLSLIKKEFGGSGTGVPASSLQYHLSFWERRRINLQENANFYRSERLILNSFDARILAIFYSKLEGIDCRDKTKVEEHIRSMPIYQLSKILDDVRRDAFPAEKPRGLPTPGKQSTDEELLDKLDRSLRGEDLVQNPPDDDEFRCHRRFLRVTSQYKALKAGIKLGDIGHLRRAIAIFAARFTSTSQHKYAFEMLHLQRLLTNAAHPTLQRAILSNMLVNLQGKENTWHETDLFIEHLNGYLKRQLVVRRTSTFNLHHLFNITAQTSEYADRVKQLIESDFGRRPIRAHTSASASEDIHLLAHELAKESIIFKSGRTSTLIPEDSYYIGLQEILRFGGGIDKLNANVVKEHDRTFADDSTEKSKRIDDILITIEDFDLEEEGLPQLPGETESVEALVEDS